MKTIQLDYVSHEIKDTKDLITSHNEKLKQLSTQEKI